MARKQFGVKHTFGLLPGRVTFVVDQKGIIRQAFSSQIRIQAHIDQAMALVKALAAQA